jgi:uncharacterized protein YcbX
MQIESLFRYPVKGLTPETLDTATLTPGRSIPWDRAFALAQGDAKFDPAHPAWLAKTNFMCLMRNPGIAAIRASFDEPTHKLNLWTPHGGALVESPFTIEGRAVIGQYLSDFLGDAARGVPEFYYVPDHSFCDHQTQVISLIGLGSIHALEAAVGAPRHPLRFRANLYITDIEPWAEFNWVGKTLAIGTARLLVTDRTIRCAATMVNPETAVRDANPIRELEQNFGHTDLGVFAEVTMPGSIQPGDIISVLD